MTICKTFLWIHIFLRDQFLDNWKHMIIISSQEKCQNVIHFHFSVLFNFYQQFCVLAFMSWMHYHFKLQWQWLEVNIRKFMPSGRDETPVYQSLGTNVWGKIILRDCDRWVLFGVITNDLFIHVLVIISLSPYTRIFSDIKAKINCL